VLWDRFVGILIREAQLAMALLLLFVAVLANFVGSVLGDMSESTEIVPL